MGFPVALLIKIFHQEKPKQDMSVFWDVDVFVSSPNGVWTSCALSNGFETSRLPDLEPKKYHGIYSTAMSKI